MAGSETVSRNLAAWADRKKAALHALGEFYAAKMEGEAKRDASWQNRTGAARQGLFGKAETRESGLVVRLAHSVEHGVYLELKNQGKYAILDPTVKRNAGDFFRDAERVIQG